MALAGKKLTPKQQAIWDMKRPVIDGGLGRSRHEIAAALGISVNVVSKTLTVIYKKLGLGVGGTPVPGNKMLEHDPELVAAAIDAAADPTAASQKAAIERVNAELKAAGIPGKVTEALVRRMRVKYANAVTVRKQITTAEILKSIDEEIHLISSYIDDKVAAEASLRDLSMAKAALIEKRALLRGEPTAILSDHERAKIADLLPQLMAEAARRGVTLEGESRRVDNAPAVGCQTAGAA